MINTDNLRNLINGGLNPKIKKFALETLKEFYIDPTGPNRILVLNSLDLIDSDSKKLDIDFFIDFEYINRLDDYLIDYFLKSLKESDLIFSNGTMRMLFDAGVVITGVELLKRKRVEKLKRVEKTKKVILDDDLFDLD